MKILEDDRFSCPVCGRRLLSLPYAAYPGGESASDAEPPYEDVWGTPSYEVCSSCGFEFGNDDNPGTTDPVSFSEYRKQWLTDGTANTCCANIGHRGDPKTCGKPATVRLATGREGEGLDFCEPHALACRDQTGAPVVERYLPPPEGFEDVL